MSASEIETLLTSAGISMGLGDINGDGTTNQIGGNLIKVAYPEVISDVSNPQSIASTATYNQYGQLVSATDPEDIVTQYGYDSNGYLNQIIQDIGGLNVTTLLSRNDVGRVTAITDPKGNTSLFTVNNLNQITEITSPTPFNYKTHISYNKNEKISQIDWETGNESNPWQSVTIEYDPLDNITSIKDELQNTTTYTYDAEENLISITDRENNTTEYTYDERNYVTSEINALSYSTSYQYDENANLISETDANSNETTYIYDLFDRLITTVYPDTTTETYSYDKNSNVINFAKRNGDELTHSYDEINRLYETTYPDSSTTTYQYDLLSRLTSILENGIETTYSYDNLSRTLNSITTIDGIAKVISYEYDANSNRTKVTYPDNLENLTYAYDELDRLTAITNATGETIASYTYNALSLRKTMNYLNGITTTYAYDDLSRLTSIISSLSSITYTHDNVGNILKKTNSDGEHNYTYDAIYQLTYVSYPDATSTTYNYDPAENRLSITNGNTTEYLSNNLNQYTEIAGTIQTYDSNGNLISNGTDTYAYDYQNRLITATTNGSETNYTYDGLNRRIRKNIAGTITNYFYDNYNLIAEYTSAWNPTIHYIHSDNIDTPLTITTQNGTYYYHSDNLGSIIHITDSSGNVVERYTYNAYGQPTILDANNNPLPTSQVNNRYMFTAREWDTETNLYYYRLRYYNPHTGRFLQPDPLGYHDSMNLYEYSWNSPTNWIDPLGLNVIDISLNPGNTPNINIQIESSSFGKDIPKVKGPPQKGDKGDNKKKEIKKGEDNGGDDNKFAKKKNEKKEDSKKDGNGNQKRKKDIFKWFSRMKKAEDAAAKKGLLKTKPERHRLSDGSLGAWHFHDKYHGKENTTQPNIHYCFHGK